MGLFAPDALRDQVAIVTGASSGLGVAIATLMGECGAQVVVMGRRTERLEEVADRLQAAGGNAKAVRVDVADPDDCRRAVREVADAAGRVDILVNNAGVGTAIPATRETVQGFRSVIATNLEGAFWMAQACVAHMPRGAAIVNVSSVLGLTTAGLPQAAYSASKAGLLGLTRDLASEWTERKGVRVNAVAPGFFHTEMTQDYSSEYVESQREHRIVARGGDPSELAHAVVFLASAAAGYVTGQVLAVDGGLTIA